MLLCRNVSYVVEGGSDLRVHVWAPSFLKSSDGLANLVVLQNSIHFLSTSSFNVIYISRVKNTNASPEYC